MDTIQNTIEINDKIFEIIEGTQSDGRCFSAAIYYLLFNRKATDEELNKWIQTYIIKPILETETTNCIKFFNWATKWAPMPKHGVNHEKGAANFTINENVSILQQILERIEKINNDINDKINGISNEVEFNNVIQKLLDDIDFIKETFNDFLEKFNDIKATIDSFIKNIIFLYITELDETIEKLLKLGMDRYGRDAGIDAYSGRDYKDLSFYRTQDIYL